MLLEKIKIYTPNSKKAIELNYPRLYTRIFYNFVFITETKIAEKVRVKNIALRITILRSYVRVQNLCLYMSILLSASRWLMETSSSNATL